MKWLKKNQIVLLVALSAAVVFLLCGGYLYYSFVLTGAIGSASLSAFGMSLQNMFETLLYNPALTISDLADAESGFADAISGNALYLVITVICGLSMVIVPAVEFFLVFGILRNVWRFSSGFGNSKATHVLIVGYGEHARQLLKQAESAYDGGRLKLYLWTEELLPEEEQKELFKAHVNVAMNEFPLNGEEENRELFNTYLRHHRIRYVILCDVSDVRNIQYYMSLSACDVCRERTVSFFVLNDLYENRLFLERLFDGRVAKHKEVCKAQREADGSGKQPDGNSHMDLRIFNFPMIQAELLYEEMPPDESARAEDKGIHMLLLGGGQVGEYMILHAMNQCVITAENPIVIEVADRDPQSIVDRLSGRFNGGYITKSRPDRDGMTEFTIPDTYTDGEFRIRVHRADVCDEARMEEIVLESVQAYGPLTYACVCVPGQNDNLACAMLLSRILSRPAARLAADGIPLALRLSDTNEMREYLAEQPAWSRVTLMGTGEERVSVRDIIDIGQEHKIREFHHVYDLITEHALGYGSDEKPGEEFEAYLDRRWNAQEYYRRQGNRALYFHLGVKRRLLGVSELPAAERDDGERTIRAHWQEMYHNLIGEGGRTDAELSERLEQDGQLSELREFARAEHRRFTLFYASEGWGNDAALHDPEHRRKDAAAKLQNCLYNWEILSASAGTKAMLVYDLLSVDSLTGAD